MIVETVNYIECYKKKGMKEEETKLRKEGEYNGEMTVSGASHGILRTS
jgi:hypothetical protein